MKSKLHCQKLYTLTCMYTVEFSQKSDGLLDWDAYLEMTSNPNCIPRFKTYFISYSDSAIVFYTFIPFLNQTAICNRIVSKSFVNSTDVEPFPECIPLSDL